MFLVDVKLFNVFINKEGYVKMCDFGISGYLVDFVVKIMDVGCKFYMVVSGFCVILSFGSWLRFRRGYIWEKIVRFYFFWLRFLFIVFFRFRIFCYRGGNLLFSLFR